MKNTIKLFEKNLNHLSDLLSATKSLEDILDKLNIIPLKEDLRSEWWELELISSVMIDKNVENISEESRKNIATALENMKNMIDEANQ